MTLRVGIIAVLVFICVSCENNLPKNKIVRTLELMTSEYNLYTNIYKYQPPKDGSTAYVLGNISVICNNCIEGKSYSFSNINLCSGKYSFNTPMVEYVPYSAFPSFVYIKGNNTYTSEVSWSSSLYQAPNLNLNQLEICKELKGTLPFGFGLKGTLPFNGLKGTLPFNYLD